MLLEWTIRSAISGLLATYVSERSLDSDHERALKAVLNSYHALSAEQRESVWHRFEHYAPMFPDLPERANSGDLFELLGSMLREARGPFDHEAANSVGKQILVSMQELKDREKFTWY